MRNKHFIGIHVIYVCMPYGEWLTVASNKVQTCIYNKLFSLKHKNLHQKKFLSAETVRL